MLQKETPNNDETENTYSSKKFEYKNHTLYRRVTSGQ